MLFMGTSFYSRTQGCAWCGSRDSNSGLNYFVQKPVQSCVYAVSDRADMAKETVEANGFSKVKTVETNPKLTFKNKK